MSQPNFSVEPNHEFKVKEKVFVIDGETGYDIWEGQIVAIENSKISVHYPEFPKEDETLENTSRLLVDNRANRRIYNQQQMTRNSKDGESDEEDPSSSDDEDESDGEEYEPGDAEPAEKMAKKAKKPKKVKKVKGKSKDISKPRPSGARTNPRRGA
jgi:hypothetical protein